jgi:hypothetical protein
MKGALILGTTEIFRNIAFNCGPTAPAVNQNIRIIFPSFRSINLNLSLSLPFIPCWSLWENHGPAKIDDPVVNDGVEWVAPPS